MNNYTRHNKKFNSTKINKLMGQFISIDVNRIKIAANESASVKNILERILPEAFEDEKIFCRIGSIFTRKKHPNNIYAVFKHKGKVKILNVTYSTFWKEIRDLNVSDLKDPNGDYLTISEFKRLSAMNDLSEIKIIEKI